MMILNNEVYNCVAQDLNTFINGLFEDWPGPFSSNYVPGTRSKLFDQIKNNESQKGVLNSALLVDSASLNFISEILLGYWLNKPVSGVREIDSDKEVINLLKEKIKTYNWMSVPVFDIITKNDNSPSVYLLKEYQKVKIYDRKKEKWDKQNVEWFLYFLLVGSHFVVIENETDPKNTLFESFKNLDKAGNAKHSHYTAHGISLNGQNYPSSKLITNIGPDLDKYTNANQACLLPVTLCDLTTNKPPYNSFFQMEGWPPGKDMFDKFSWSGLSRPEYINNKALIGGYRHGADFKTHIQSLWNISTYGACPYSEKRGGTIFLSKQEWAGDCKPNKETIMAPYRGAEVPQKWLQKEFVKCPSSILT